MELAASTLSDWVAAGADTFQAIYWELVQQAMQAHVLGTDDTGLRVLDKNHDNGIRKGYMWAYVADQRIVVFDYTPDRKSEGPASFLVKRTGLVQCDGYTGYKRIAREHREVVWAGCLAHARRKFVEALDGGDKRAAMAIALLRGLYEIEADATAAGLDHEQRLQQRQTIGRRYSSNFTPDTTLDADATTIALWHFDEGSGTVCEDASANNYDGQLITATWQESCPTE